MTTPLARSVCHVCAHSCTREYWRSVMHEHIPLRVQQCNNMYSKTLVSSAHHTYTCHAPSLIDLSTADEASRNVRRAGSSSAMGLPKHSRTITFIVMECTSMRISRGVDPDTAHVLHSRDTSSLMMGTYPFTFGYDSSIVTARLRFRRHTSPSFCAMVRVPLFVMILAAVRRGRPLVALPCAQNASESASEDEMIATRNSPHVVVATSPAVHYQHSSESRINTQHPAFPWSV